MILNKWKPSRTIEYTLYRDLQRKNVIVSKNKEIYEYSQYRKTYNPIGVEEGNGFEIYIARHSYNKYIRHNGKFSVVQYARGNYICHGNFFITKDYICYINEQKRLINIEDNNNKYLFLTSTRFLTSQHSYDDIFMSIVYDRNDTCSQILLGFDRKNGKFYKFKIKTDVSVDQYRHAKFISRLLEDNSISSRLPSDDHLTLIKNKLNEIEGLKVIDFCEYQ